MRWITGISLFLRLPRPAAEPFCFQLSQRHPQPPSALSGWESVDQPAQLEHGSPGIVQIILVQLDEGQSNPKIIARSQCACSSQVVQLEGSGLRLLQRPRQESSTPQRSIDALGFVSGPLRVRISSRLHVTTGRKPLDAGIATPDANRSGVRQEVEESIDDRFEYAGQKAYYQAIYSPECDHQLQGSRVGA